MIYGYHTNQWVLFFIWLTGRPWSILPGFPCQFLGLFLGELHRAASVISCKLGRSGHPFGLLIWNLVSLDSKRLSFLGKVQYQLTRYGVQTPCLCIVGQIRNQLDEVSLFRRHFCHRSIFDLVTVDPLLLRYYQVWDHHIHILRNELSLRFSELPCLDRWYS